MTQKPLRSQKRTGKGPAAAETMIEIDAYRTLVFPNRIRKYRKQLNIGSLLELSEQLPTITYIRLSKIERGEIFARAGELREIARALGIDPQDLLIDVDDPEFDIAAWAEPLHGADRSDPEAERFAVLLAAALRVRRAGDPALTIATLEHEHGLAPVILSRIENALKPYNRWNDDVRATLRRLFDVSNDRQLAEHIAAVHSRGELDAVLPMIANPELRIGKTRVRVASLRDELDAGSGSIIARPRRLNIPHPLGERLIPVQDAAPAVLADDAAGHRMVAVFGTPLPDGLIARTPVDAHVEAPRNAGPRAYGLRMGRPTLGAGLPGRATLIVDPDRFPSAGGLAVITNEQGLRVLSVTFDRHGRMLGYSENPDLEIEIDGLDPANVATVLAAVFE
ncbi:hypothetical protein ADT71_14275 [Novosphingobium sp. ST904]|nr:hypothetical protein ADT71_14275 [Novosphingobium sp. ST904]TCM39181.1 hypothetical protein EDF59_10661 [Novosphingobium sp. ST904]